MREGRNGCPDRGWAWIVAFAACFNSLVLAGIFRTSGVLFVAFISTFGVTREEASWPVVLCISVLNLTGPFSGILGQRYGIRPVTIAGALVATVGVSACYFTTSLKVITIFFGIIFGIGYGLVSTLMPIIVNKYFLNLRATANGIANSGSCFGSMILPVFFEFLIEHYGLSGCFLLTGGVVLHIVVAGALLRPPDWLQEEPKVDKKSSSCGVPEGISISRKKDPEWLETSQNKHCNISNYDAVVKSIQLRNSKLANSENQKSVNTNILKISEFDTSLETGRNPIPPADAELRSESACMLKRAYSRHCENRKISKESQISDSCDSVTQSERLKICENENELEKELQKSLEDFEKSLNNFSFILPHATCNQNGILRENNNRQEMSLETKTDVIDMCPKRVSSLVFQKTSNNPESCAPSVTLKEVSNNASSPRDNSTYSPRFIHLKRTDEAPEVNNKETYEINSYPELERKELDKLLSSTHNPEKENRNAWLEIMQSFSVVLLCPMFYVTAITNVSFYFLFHMYVVIVVDYAVDQGVQNSRTKFILFAFSLSDLFGRLCLGWITDRNFLKRSHFVMGCMATIGLVFFFFPFATNYESLIAVSCFYGVLLGCTMVVFPILLVDFLGMDLHPVAFGCMCFMNGCASFLRPFLIGYFRDNIGSYANIFYILGAISLAASMLWLLEGCLTKKSKTTTECLSA